MSSSIYYLVAPVEGELKSFDSLEEAKRYAVQEGISYVRRVKQGKVGYYYEMTPIEVKNSK